MRCVSVLLVAFIAHVLVAQDVISGPYEDLDLSLEQPRNEVVEVIQDSPHSNSVHIAHNIPVGSDILVKQTNPYNASVHISLNIARDSKVKVEMSGMVNCNLHVSLNNGANCMVDVVVNTVFNSSIHVSFQNPVNTPANVEINDATLTNIHVSQNVPRNSPVDFKLANPTENEIHASQSSPQSSPFTFTINGEKGENQIEVSQNAADDASPLTCSPECPPPPPEYEGDYPDEAESQAQLQGLFDFYNDRRDQRRGQQQPQRNSNSNNQASNSNNDNSNYNNGGTTSYPKQSSGNNNYNTEPISGPNVGSSGFNSVNNIRPQDSSSSTSQKVVVSTIENSNQVVIPDPTTENTVPLLPVDDIEIDYGQDYDSSVAPQVSSIRTTTVHNANRNRDDPYSVNDQHNDAQSLVQGVQAGDSHQGLLEAPSTAECPGGSLDICIDSCPGGHAKAFAICVAQCGKRCP